MAASPWRLSGCPQLYWGHREARGRTLVLPVGSIEDRPTGPMALDTLLALATACLAAGQQGWLIAWPLGYGYSPAHRYWAGPRSIALLERLIGDIVSSLLSLEPRCLLVLDAHLGHEHTVRKAAEGSGAVYANLWRLLERLGLRGWSRQLGFEAEAWRMLREGRVHPLLVKAAERLADTCRRERE